MKIDINPFVLPTDYTKLDWRKGETAAVREQYIAQQEGKCYWCNNLLEGPPTQAILDKKVNWCLFPEAFRNSPIHLQHDHHTNMTEGAVHMRCNAVMWEHHGR